MPLKKDASDPGILTVESNTASESATSPRTSVSRKIAAGLIVLAGFAFILTLFVVGLNDRSAAERDFISYWAAARLTITGGNPYDPAAVRVTELGSGRDGNALVLVMRNPPIALPLVAGLGFLSPKNGLIFWLFLLMFTYGLSIWLIWRMHGKPSSTYHVMAVGFAPALACLMAGQFGIFLLLGVVLFLTFEQTFPVLAGASLLLCALKPHLFLPFAISLLLWIVAGRRVAVAAGFLASLSAALSVALLLDRHALEQYLAFMRAGEATSERVPALSVALRFALSPHSIFIQFIPLVFACIWAAWYFWTRRGHWTWSNHGLLVLLVGAVCTPYGFFTDECMLLPAVLAGVYRAKARNRSLIPIGVFAGAAAAELLAGVKITTPYFMWTTPAWLAWYLYANSGSNPESEG